MAIRKKHLARRVYGVARRPETIRQAKSRGAIDSGGTSLKEGLAQADLVILATPPATIVPLVEEIIQLVARPILVTDVASTKSEIVRSIENRIRTEKSSLQFVGGHPIAGSEQSGISAAREDLFEGATCVLTPTQQTSQQATSLVRFLWKTLDTKVVELTPERHDKLIAEASHVPHLAAGGVIMATSGGAFELAGSGFRDATRIAASSPDMWTEVCRTNPKPIIQMLNRLITQLEKIKKLVTKGEGVALRRQLELARRRRQSLLKSRGRPRGAG